MSDEMIGDVRQLEQLAEIVHAEFAPRAVERGDPMRRPTLARKVRAMLLRCEERHGRKDREPRNPASLGFPTRVHRSAFPFYIRGVLGRASGSFGMSSGRV